MKRILLSLGCCFYLSANQIVHDVNTGLMWQDIAPIENNKMNWNNAMQHCSNLTFNGFSDWRLPTLFELKNVVDKKMTVVEIKDGTRMSRRKMKEGFQNIDLATFWTGSESSGYKDKAWIVYAGYSGVDNIQPKLYNNDVMCVRDSKDTLKFDSFSSLKSALKSKYSGKELTQKTLEIYYGKPSITDLKYDAYSSTFSAIGSFGGDNLSKNITLAMTPSEAKDFFDNYKNITPSGVFDVRDNKATLKTIRFKNNGKTYNSVFVDKPIEADEIQQFKDSDDGKMLQVITTDNTMYLIDKSSSKVVAVLDASQASHMSFQTTSKDNNFAMLLDTNTNSYVVLDPKTKKELFRLPDTYNNIGTFTISPDNAYATLIAKDNTSFTLFDIATKKELLTLQGSFDNYKTFSVSPDKHYLSLVGKDNSFKILDLTTQKEIVTLVGNYNNVKSFELSSDNKYLTLTTNENQYKILDVTSKKELITLTTPNQLGNFTTLNVSDNKQFIALTRADNTLVVLDAITKKELFSLASPVANTTSLVFDDLKKTVTLSNASGEKQTLKLSDYIEKQNYLVIVDNSANMKLLDPTSNITRMELAKKSIKDNIAQLDRDKVNVGLTYLDGSCTNTNTIAPSKTSINDVLNSINTITPNGEAPLALALDKTAKYLQDSNGTTKTNLLIITSGVDSCGGDIVASAKKLMDIPNIELKLNVIGFNTTITSKEQLAELGKLNNTSYNDVKNIEEMNTALNTIAKEDNIKGEHFTDDGKGFAFQVNFAYRSDAIDEKYNAIVEELANYIKTNKYPTLIEGHTDAKGNPKFNKELSKKRADSLVKQLIQLGVDKKLLKSSGAGSEKPIADNETEEGISKNRRVEAHFVK